MSYILDALKKNKNNDEQSDVPDLSSEHAHHEFEEEKSLTRWVWPIVVMVLVLTIAVLIFMLANPSAQQVSKQWVQQEQVSSSSAEESQLLQQEKANHSTQNEASNDAEVVNKPLQVAEPVVKKVRRASVVSNTNNKQQTNQQSSPSKSTSLTQGDLPSLVYTTHIYATQAKDRFVMLNGKAYGEGDSIDVNLKVKEILENDLVVVYKGQEFVIPSLEDVNVD